MGTSRSAVELGRKFDQLASEIEARQRSAAEAGALQVVGAVRPLMNRATGGDGKLSGTGRTTGHRVKRAGLEKKIGARYKMEQRSTGWQAFVKATGPAHLIESDIEKHYVFSRFARAGGQRMTRSVAMTDAMGQVVRTGSGRVKRRRIDTRSEAFAAGESVTGGRRAVLNLGGGQFRRWTVAYSKGRHPWRDGVKASRGRALIAMRREELAGIAKVFR